MPRDSVRDVERKYYRSLDPFVTLTAAAAATTTLRLGFGIMLLPQRDPITTAKAIASLDYVSGGRVEVGLGAGWNVPEIENHGTPFGQRFGVMRERAEAMKAIWTQDEASYHGKHVNFDTIMSWPKPVQKPHPPLWIGGAGREGASTACCATATAGSRTRATRRRPARRARSPSCAGAARRPGAGASPSRAFGVPIDAGGRRGSSTSAGVDRVLFMLPSAERAEVERAADEAAALAARLR